MADDATIISTGCGVFAITEALPSVLHALGAPKTP
jgi:hypothetical protein